MMGSIVGSAQLTRPMPIPYVRSASKGQSWLSLPISGRPQLLDWAPSSR
jgi:hypothetical protein